MPLILDGSGITERELEKLRLLLSVFQDGTGMLSTDDHSDLYAQISGKKLKSRKKNSKSIQLLLDPVFRAEEELVQLPAIPEKSQRTLPGWRDFERATALAFDGIALESKAIVDIVIPIGDGTYYGLSCKSRRELNAARNANGRVYIEVSNAAGGFWDYVKTKGVDETNYREAGKATIMGHALFELIEQWHEQVSLANGGLIDLTKSSYLVLLYNKQGLYKLYQFPLKFPKAEELTWSIPLRTPKDQPPQHRRSLVATDSTGGRLIEWYFSSGGQLKYYPLASEAVWASREFMLEPLPPRTKHGILSRVEEYFPNLWKLVNK